MRTTTGRNLRLLRELSGLDPWVFGSARLKEELVKFEMKEVPPLDQWRVPYLSSLLERRQVLHYQGDIEGEQELSDLVDSICVN